MLCPVSRADPFIPYGPIPEGEYFIDPSKIQKWEDLAWWRKFRAEVLGWGTWFGGPKTWGYYRVPIIDPTGNFQGGFVHGGVWETGTIGCIKIREDLSFFNYLSQQKGLIPLTVNYRGGF